MTTGASVVIRVDDLLDWSCSSSIDNGNTAELTLDNSDRIYDVASLLGQPINIRASSETTFGAGVVVFTGIINSVDPNYGPGYGATVKVSCVSYFNALERKPINTEAFATTTGANLLVAILGQYACYASSYYSFSASNATSTVFDSIIISEESTIFACKQIAQACLCELFVGTDGILTVENKKGGTALGSGYTLSAELVKGASRIISNESGFSVVRCRGKYQTDVTANNILFDGVVQVDGGTGGLTQIQVFLLLSGTPEQLANAQVVTNTPFCSVAITDSSQIGQNYLGVTFYRVIAFPVGTTQVNLKITTLDINEKELTSISTQQHTYPKVKPTKLLRSVEHFTFSPRLLGTVQNRSQKPADEAEENRLESVQRNDTLIGQIGVRWQEVDNPYIPTLGRCAEVASRTLEEFLMSKKMWRVSSTFKQEIKLNAIVTFTVPDTLGSTVTGVVREVSLKYSNNPLSLTCDFVLEELLNVTTNPQGMVDAPGVYIEGTVALSAARLSGSVPMLF